MVARNDRSNDLHVPSRMSRTLGVIVDQEGNIGCGRSVSDERKEKSIQWSLSEEVAKVIEVGVVLGFDFNGNKKLVEEEETKLKSFDFRTFKSWLSKGIGVEAVGSAGGLFTLWNEDFFEVKACILNNRCIIISGVLTKLKEAVNFCNVYADNQESGKIELWNFILNAQSALSGTWVIEGDFNTVLSQSKRSGYSGNSSSIRNFNSFIQAAMVVDIPIQGVSKEDWGPIPFRFQNGWLENNELMKGVKETWKSCGGGGSFGVNTARKSREVNRFMKAWAKGKKSCGDSLKILEAELEGIEKKAVLGGWSDSLRQKRKSCLVKMWRIIRQEEQKWRQCSRIKWLKESDGNSTFFHLMANLRRKINYIGEMTIRRQ
ncbi:hypothetical protein Ddye_009162 [Dipteronia dyeriana]|uniref:Reverse transcriptase n=1 Tax=Dipteronia dyeriana TaxID=168575 RepID=A0AAE0CM02_9ROSI|nr:hypothetical protein Ddye_009162 [Dipteronia dyeriana]